MVNQLRQWYTVKNAASEDGPAEILIYDVIDSTFGFSAEQLVRDLAGITASDITVRINSPGGSVFDGIAILNALRGHDAKVTTVVDGVAASIASVIAMGGDEIVMNQNSTMMLHNAWDICVGNADEMQKAADFLRQVSGNIANIYAERAGGTADEWKSVMDAETWYTADEAVAAGLADLVLAETVKESAMALYSQAGPFDLSKFKYPGRDAAPAPIILARNQTPPPQVEAEVNKGKEPPVATLNESIVEVLGLDAEADDDAIKTAVAELKERADNPADPPADPVEPSVEDLASVAAKHNLTVMDKDQHAALLAQAQQGAEARAQQVREADERVVDQAIVAGKIPPARRDHHLQALALDREGHAAVLNALAPGLVPLAEVGHGVTAEIASEDDAVYASLFGATTGKDA